MLKFNENGYLEPFQAIVTELETAKSVFTFNKQRSIMWSRFEDFIHTKPQNHYPFRVVVVHYRTSRLATNSFQYLVEW